MGILQASSTQSDYVVTFWLVCFVYYVVLFLDLACSGGTLVDLASKDLGRVSLGLAFLTKPTAYLLIPPFLGLASLSHWHEIWWIKSIKIVLAISVIAFGY